MTPAVRAFVERFVTSEQIAGQTLEIGSFDVNGNLRDIFLNYTGLDMRNGPNVDLVASSHDIPLSSHIFDTIVCVEMLEHDSAPWVTADEILRLLKKGGRLIASAPGIGFPRHDYPSDYWRFTPDGLRVLFCSLSPEHVSGDRDHSFFVGHS